jgi:hypothetical protein
VNSASPLGNEPAAAMSDMLVSLWSRASVQLAELAGPFEKVLCDDPVGTAPWQAGSAAAKPAKPIELTANPPATSSVFANKTILTIAYAFPSR